MPTKDNRKKEKRRLLFWFVSLLVVSVVATSILTVKIMDKYYYDSSGAIEISPQNPHAFPEQPTTDAPQPETETQPTTSTHTVDKQVAVPTTPGFAVTDENGKWSTNTQINIFKSSYDGVDSADGSKIIAPGTANSYVFKLANTGDVGLDFTLDIDAFITPDSVHIPVQTRLQRYDSKWIAGDEAIWVDTQSLDTATDKGQLGIGKYVYYTLDWQWPYSDDDTLDTALGNQAVDEDISLTIVIKTTASGDSEAMAGIKIPDTSDNTSVAVWATVAACSTVAIVAIFFFIILTRDKEEEEKTA